MRIRDWSSDVCSSDLRTAWFVPAVKDACRVPVEGRFVVTRTRDGGASFETLGEGLPQDAAYALVYRHALDVDAAGKSLAMGPTTAALWIGRKGGAAWALLSSQPPRSGGSSGGKKCVCTSTFRVARYHQEKKKHY